MEPLSADIWYALVRFGRWEDILARPEPVERGEADDTGIYSNRNFVTIAICQWAKAVQIHHLNTKFIILNTEFVILNTEFIIFRCPLRPSAAWTRH